MFEMSKHLPGSPLLEVGRGRPSGRQVRGVRWGAVVAGESCREDSVPSGLRSRSPLEVSRPGQGPLKLTPG